MAEAITAAVLERMADGVAGLRIRFMDELAAAIVNASGQTPHLATAAERRLAMRTAVRAVDHPMMDGRGVAAMLERSYRDVRDGGLTLAELSRRIRSRRGDTIVRAWTEYERLIAQLNAVDNADLLADATRLVSASLRPQLLAGFYDMTGAQQRLVQTLIAADRIAAVWVPTDLPFAQRFIDSIAAGDSPVNRIRPRQTATGNRQRQYDTRFDELRGACVQIADLLANGTPAREIGIVARSFEPYDVRLLNRFASEAGFRTTMADEIPLTAHRIGRGAVTLLRLRDRGFPRADALELVRDGLYTKTSLNVDAVDAATRRARIAGGTSPELLTMRRRTPIIDDFIALVSELEELTSSIDTSLLSRLGGLFRIETELDLAAAEKLDAIATLFERASAWNRGFDLASVIDAIEQESLPCQPTAGDQPMVWAGELLRFRGRSFTHLFVLRMQDDVFPQRRIEDPLLPDSERRHLGLREIGDGRDEERLLFSLLGDAATEPVHYSFASGDGFGKVLRQSRFLRSVASDPSPMRESSRNPQPATRNLPRQLQLLARSGTRSPFDGYVGPIVAERLTALSPTQLEDFGECPQKFFFKHILGATDIDDPEREVQINHREKGTIDHRILERFYRGITAEEIARAAAALPKLPDSIVERLDSIIDEQFDELERDVPPFNRTVRDIERRATKRILREFLAQDLADLDAQQLVPRWFEYRFGTKHKEIADHPDPYVVRAGGVPVRVEGTIDRIDAGDARLRIVDYKSGKALRHQNLSEKIDRGVRLQLALYAMAVSDFFEVDAAKISGTIKPLVVGEKAKFAFDLHEKRETLLETLEIFMRAILSGSFPAFPNDNDAEFNSCKYCPVNHSCRTKHDPEERYAIQQLRDPRTLLGGGASR
jgi:RecB family exonuclease